MLLARRSSGQSINFIELAGMTTPRRRRKKATRLSVKSAVERLDAMQPLIERDARVALRTFAMSTAGNTVVEELELQGHPGAGAYRTLQESLANHLTLVLAKLYELPSPGDAAPSKRHNKSDVASIPLMIRLLKQAQCRKALIQRARHWTPSMKDLAASHAASCEREIDRILTNFALLRSRKKGQVSLIKLKKVRDEIIAHTLIRERTTVAPKWNDAFLHLVFATDIADSASFAISGRAIKIGNGFGKLSDDFRSFWRTALAANPAEYMSDAIG